MVSAGWFFLMKGVYLVASDIFHIIDQHVRVFC